MYILLVIAQNWGSAQNFLSVLLQLTKTDSLTTSPHFAALKKVILLSMCQNDSVHQNLNLGKPRWPNSTFLLRLNLIGCSHGITTK
jgi:hypothetical protein